MKKFISIAITAVLAFSLVGCNTSNKDTAGTKTTDTTKTEEKVETKTEEPKSEGLKKITFMDSMPNPERSAAFQRYVIDFNTANAGKIEVTYESVPWDDSHNKLVSLAVAKSLPDIVQLHSTWYSEFVSAEWVTPITEEFNSFEGKDGLAPVVTKKMIESDQLDVYKDIYAMPEGASANGVFVRSDWMKEAGVSYDENWTWDDFFDLAEKLTDPAKNRYGLSYRGARAGFDQINWYVYSQNLGNSFYEDGTSSWLKPESLDAFIRYTDTYKKGFAPKDSINWGYPEMVQGFMSGLTGMLIQTTEVVQVAEQTFEPDQWEVMPIPKNKNTGKYYVSVGSSVNNAISAFSPNKAEAWEFIAYLTSPDVNMDLCKVNYLIPLVAEASKDEFFSGNMKGYIDLVNSKDLVITASEGYFPELGEFRENYMDSEIQKYLLDQQSAEDAVKHLGEKLTGYQQAFMKSSPETPMPTPFSMD